MAVLRFVIPPELSWAADEKEIPFRNDRKKGKGKGKYGFVTAMEKGAAGWIPAAPWF